MVAKYYCDGCGKEMRKEDHGRLTRAKNGVSVQVITAYDSAWNAGHICHECVIATVNDGVDLSVSTIEKMTTD